MEYTSLDPGPKGEYYLQENVYEFGHSFRKKEICFARHTQRQTVMNEFSGCSKNHQQRYQQRQI